MSFIPVSVAQKADIVVDETSEVELDPSSGTSLPVEQIKNFAEIFTRIKRFYVEPVTDEELLEYAVTGMLNGLDPHSVYLKGEKYEDLNEGTTGAFGGLGIEVVMDNGYVKVVTPVDDTPAAEAGLLTGDLIIKIDNESLTGLSLRESTNRMRGKPGTKISVTVLREGEVEPITYNLERAIIRQPSIKRLRMSDQIGYLRVSQFQLNTSESFRKELKQLTEIDTMEGLILDLRSNPGGLLNAAISISDAFLTEGAIVSTKGRVSENDQEYFATPTDLTNGMPIVVLINGGSASASEIVAGALKDHRRAILLGTETFGKGSVQTVMELNEEEAIKITTARYYTPNGTSIQASGIQPDIEVEQRYPNQEVREERGIKEKDLPKSLKNTESNAKEKPVNEEIETILNNDYQLFEAFKLLQGITLFNRVPKPETKESTN